jgi:hypothetical protein
LFTVFEVKTVVVHESNLYSSFPITSEANQ